MAFLENHSEKAQQRALKRQAEEAKKQHREARRAAEKAAKARQEDDRRRNLEMKQELKQTSKNKSKDEKGRAVRPRRRMRQHGASNVIHPEAQSEADHTGLKATECEEVMSVDTATLSGNTSLQPGEQSSGVVEGPEEAESSIQGWTTFTRKKKGRMLAEHTEESSACDQTAPSSGEGRQRTTRISEEGKRGARPHDEGCQAKYTYDVTATPFVPQSRRCVVKTTDATHSIGADDEMPEAPSSTTGESEEEEGSCSTALSESTQALQGSWGLGVEVVVEGRGGTVSWDGRPLHQFAKVVWDDTKEESDVIDADAVHRVDLSPLLARIDSPRTSSDYAGAPFLRTASRVLASSRVDEATCFQRMVRYSKESKWHRKAQAVGLRMALLSVNSRSSTPSILSLRPQPPQMPVQRCFSDIKSSWCAAMKTPPALPESLELGTPPHKSGGLDPATPDVWLLDEPDKWAPLPSRPQSKDGAGGGCHPENQPEAPNVKRKLSGSVTQLSYAVIAAINT